MATEFIRDLFSIAAPPKLPLRAMPDVWMPNQPYSKGSFRRRSQHDASSRHFLARQSRASTSTLLLVLASTVRYAARLWGTSGAYCPLHRPSRADVHHVDVVVGPFPSVVLSSASCGRDANLAAELLLTVFVGDLLGTLNGVVPWGRRQRRGSQRIVSPCMQHERGEGSLKDERARRGPRARTRGLSRRSLVRAGSQCPSVTLSFV